MWLKFLSFQVLKLFDVFIGRGQLKRKVHAAASR